MTFLLSDIERSTQLWQAAGDDAGAAVRRHLALVHAAVDLRGGVLPLEQGEGDSVVAAFARAADAVAAALDVQRTLAEEDWPERAPIRVRLGVHTGDAELRDERNYFGPAIIRCARLRDLGHGGQTLLSGTTHDLVVDDLPAGAWLSDLGTHRLKGLARSERVWQLCDAELANDFPALRQTAPSPGSLPRPVTGLIGREAAVAEIGDGVRGHRLVTLTGAGGSGKTRLAIAVAGNVDVAGDVAGAAPGGVRFVDLSAVADPALVDRAVASAFGFQEEPDGRAMADTLADQLQAADVLIVLDNCEHVLDACTDLVARLLTWTSAVRFLTTSREVLGVEGEWVWRVPSLDAEAAVRLFAVRAGETRPGFPADRDHEAIREICERLDRLPLAIELAAAQVRVMSPTRLLGQLDDRFRAVTGSRRARLARQRTLEASVAWSYGLLADRERLALRRLSVFAGGFTLDAAEAVVGRPPIEPYDVLDLVTGLVDKSLVVADDTAPDVRFRILETIRHYARERGEEEHDAAEARRAHHAYFAALARRAEPELAGGAGPAWLAQLEQELPNLRLALDWAADGDEPGSADAFLALATSLTLYWELRGRLREGGQWFARALAAEPSSPPLRARALWGAAHVALYGDDDDTARARAGEALELAADLDDAWTQARALNTCGYLDAFDDPPQARSELARSIALGRELGDPWVVADGVKMLTITHLITEDLDGLGDSSGELRRVAAALGNRFFLAWADFCDGTIDLRRGRLRPAAEHFERSVALGAEVGDPATATIAVAGLAEVELAEGRIDESSDRLEASFRRANAIGGHTGVLHTVMAIVTNLIARGDSPTALGVLEFVTTANPWAASWVALLEGIARLALDDDGAAARLRDAETLALSIGNNHRAAGAAHHLGRLERRAGRPARAEAHLHRALALRRGGGDLGGIVETLEELAGVAAQLDSGEEALRLLACSARVREELGLRPWPILAAGLASDLDAAERLLTPEQRDQARQEGTALSLDDAAAYASRARGERKRAASGWESLTPTELRIVELVTHGLTNPQIGERMFITRGTVKTHLAHVFVKLGVSSRTELAAVALAR